MDAVTYQMSFDKEQLALLCANYDRRIDSLGAENKKLKAKNEKLRNLLRAAYNCANAGPSCLECRVVAGGCTLLTTMRELGVEVDK